MDKKTILLIGVLSVVAIVVAIVLRGFKGQGLPTNLEDIKCVYSISVSGQAMEPAIKSGTRLMLSKCFKDKQNMAVGAIVVFTDSGVTKVGRIKEKVVLQEGVFYKIGRDARQGEEFTVSPDNILASDEK